MQMSVSFAASCGDHFVAPLGCFQISSCPIFSDVEESSESETLALRLPRAVSFCNTSDGFFRLFF